MLFFTVIVSSLIWVTQGTPSGNHTCTGVVKHPVTVRVNVTEPVTYRTYTWCLRVPPRCSKYTIQLQDRVKIHTEMHNRTITVCCKGYVEMNYKCVPACPPQTDCPFMHCNRTNHCYCTPGYTGLYCNDPCDRGFWGENCMKECDCPPGYTCHHLTGDCMLDEKRPPSKSRRTTTTTTSEQIKFTVPTLTTSMERETTVTPVLVTEPTSRETTIQRTTTPSAPFITTSSRITEIASNPTLLTSKMMKNVTTESSNFETWATTQAESNKKETTHLSTSTMQSTMSITLPKKVVGSTSTSNIDNLSTVQMVLHSTYPTTVSTIASSTSDFTFRDNKQFVSTKYATPFETTTNPSTMITTIVHNVTGTEGTEIFNTSSTTPGISKVSLDLKTSFSKDFVPITTKVHDYTIFSTNTEVIKTTDSLPTHSKPEPSHTIVTVPNDEKTNIFINTGGSSTSKSLDNQYGVVEMIQTTSTEKALDEKLPPLLVNPKRISSESTRGTYSTSFQKETLDEFSTIPPSTVPSLSKSNKNKVVSVSFPHQPKIKDVDKGAKLFTISATKTTTTAPTLSQQSSLSVSVSTTTSALSKTAHSVAAEVISNNEDSITSKRPFVREKTTQNTPEKPLFMDTNKRLWEIFETGLNLKTTMSPARALRTTTVPPTKPTDVEELEQYGNLEMPIKKSHIYTNKPSSETLSIKTVRPLVDFEKEASTNSPQIQKQPKHKEKYQKKHKSKIYDASATTVTHHHQTVEGILTFSSTDEKHFQNKSPLHTFLNPTESLLATSKTSPNVKEADPHTTSENPPNPTSARPSHTWYSHAREKAKIKEALKSLKTTSQLDNAVRPTTSFDNDSNDINMMQTTFTEGKNVKEAEDDKMKELYLKENTINMTRTETQYTPSRITAANESLFSFDSSTFTLNILCALMFVVVITLLWLHLTKKRKSGRVSPDRRTTNASQDDTISPTYETVFPLNQCPESLESTTFFGPIITTYYADKINRGAMEVNYDHPRSPNFNEQTVPYSEAQFDYF